MKHNNEKGFSLIELLIVLVIIGIIAGIASGFYIRARVGAENKAAVAHLSLLRSAQAQFYAQNSRYGQLNEIKQTQNIDVGFMQSPAVFRRGRYTYTLTSTDLKNDYTITATRVNDTPTPFLFTLDHSGVIDGEYDF